MQPRIASARVEVEQSKRALDRTSPLPLWAQLESELRRRTAADEFAEGFPGELELSDEYGVSRNTVREALRRLRSDGLVVAGRGRRPRVADAFEIEQPLGALYSLYDAVESAGLEQRNIVRALDVRSDADAAARLGLRASARLLYLERLRFAGDDPLAVDQVWFPARLAAPLLKVDFSHAGFYDELASRTGVRLTEGSEHLRAVVPNRDERALLGIRSGVAAFVIDRLGSVRRQPVEWRRTLVRADRFSVSAAFSSVGGYRLDVSRDLPVARASA